MSARRLPLFLLGFLLLLASCALAQSHGGGGGGGGGHTTTSTPSPTRSTSTTPPSGMNSLPGSVPIQTADQEGKIEFRSETILVQVPIVITDKSGNHVHGLTKDDVHVFENGKEQNVSTFEEIVSTNTKFPAVAAKPGEFSNLTLSEQQPRTVTVIALDTVNTPFLDQTYGRRELVKYLAESLDSGQVLALMIITSHGVEIVQGLTGDPAQLLQMLKKVSGEFPAMQGVGIDAQADAAVGDISGISMATTGTDPTAAMSSFVQHGDSMYAQFQQANAIETTMNAFLGIAWSLSGVPGRKSLIWATGGFPFTISSPAAVPGGYLSTLYERTMGALTAAQISVYPVDVRGLVNTSPIGNATSSGVRSGQALMRQLNNRAWLQQSSIDSLNEFADMTGGKAFYNTNDLASCFKRAADDASSYYLAGYYLDLHNDHAGWRQLKVKVDKKDTEVRARKGFFVTNATIHAELTRNSDLSYAMSSPIEGTGVPITMQWAGLTASGDKKRAVFLAQLPAKGLAFDPAGQNKLNFDIAAVAFGEKDGKEAARSTMNFAKPVPDDKLAGFRAEGVKYRGSLDLVPGKYVVRVVVRDNVTGKIGSVTAPLTVN